MNKKNQIGIFGLDYENNLENFYINALKKLKYNNIKFLKNNHLFYIFCLLKRLNIKCLFKIFNFFENLKFKKFILKNDLKLLIIFKGIELNSNIYKTIRKKKIILINIYTDDPFNFNSSATSSKNIISNIDKYDFFCIFSKKIKTKLEKKFKSTNFFYLPFGYCKDKHLRSKNKIVQKKISFIGSYDKKRYKLLKGINHSIDVYGNNWPTFKNHKNHKYVINEELTKIVAQSEISLNILRKQNLTSHNMRAFEITSMGGLMLTTRTNEQNTFFPENKASFMFSNIQELNEKIKYILNHKNKSKKIRQKGYILSRKHSYEARVKSLIKYIDANKKFYNF